MPAANKVLKNFALFVDGFGYAGNADSVQLPTVEVIKEDYRAAGMDGSIALDMGLSAMECSFTLSSFDANALATWGLGEGYMVPVIVRGALESTNGNVEQVVAYMRGTIRSVTPSEFTPGAKATLAFVMDVREYKHEQGGQVVYDIDVVNSKRVIRGVDRNAAINNALGIGGGSLLSDLAQASGIARQINRVGQALGL